MATLKQKRAMDLLLENVGMSTGEAMRLAGYSKATSLTPQRLTQRPAFISIAESLSDELLATRHLELLNKRDKNGPDTFAVKAGLDMAYKIKSTYAPEKTLNATVNLNKIINPKSEALLLEFEQKLQNDMLEDKNEGV